MKESSRKAKNIHVHVAEKIAVRISCFWCHNYSHVHDNVDTRNCVVT